MSAIERLEKALGINEEPPTTISATDKLKLMLSGIADFRAEHPLDEVNLAGCSLDTHPTKHNWVEDAGGLPEYICEIARALVRSGKDTSTAISIAVSRCKVWASGGGNVNADTRAKAAAAVTEWEAKKARAKGTK